MGKKILIVDDSRTIRQSVSFTLGREGFDVVEADGGEKGLEALDANPDVAMVISDVNMPNLNGLEMVEKIAQSKDLSVFPVIFLTTEGSTELIDRAKKTGAKGWLVKPFQPDQLINAVQTLTADT